MLLEVTATMCELSWEAATLSMIMSCLSKNMKKYWVNIEIHIFAKLFKFNFIIDILKKYYLTHLRVLCENFQGGRLVVRAT